MPLLGTCPRCRAVAPIGAYLADGEVRAAWDRLERRYAPHPALLARVLRYLDLHAPAESRVHGPKLVRLLDELADLVGTGRVQRDGRTLAAPPELWALAMDAALDAAQRGTLRLPLPDGFGWLSGTVGNLALDPVQVAAAERLARAPRPADSPAAATPAAPDPTADPTADLRELIADLAHWTRLASADAPGAAAERDRLAARYVSITGRPWGDRHTAGA